MVENDLGRALFSNLNYSCDIYFQQESLALNHIVVRTLSRMKTTNSLEVRKQGESPKKIIFGVIQDVNMVPWLLDIVFRPNDLILK